MFRSWWLIPNSGGKLLPGEIISYASETVPDGFLECNGSSLLRTDYAKLFTAIGTVWGTADATHFNIPDLRGKFPRGWAHGTANDPDRASRTANATGGETGDKVGSVQGHNYVSHAHYVPLSANFTNTGGGYSPDRNTFVWGGFYISLSNVGGNETRPINVSLIYIIKY
jgi:microcystin-dependent protein